MVTWLDLPYLPGRDLSGRDLLQHQDCNMFRYELYELFITCFHEKQILSFHFWPIRKVLFVHFLLWNWFFFHLSNRTFKLNLEFSFSFSGLGLVFKSGFQTWDSLHMYFNFSFNLFLSNYLVFGFLQGSAVKPRFWTIFSVNYCFFAQQPRINVFKIQVFNSQFLHKLIFHFPGQTRKWPFPGLL